ncbi:acetylornithine deacetylase [Seongchinamella sediminis]|uniref:Acetylornithine deacetylase n=1 Tax=Seongchinamella sediminis TaxID=2283635 RepID=A0A3L7E1G5_9GAMM|nr:acetylornithine deacetylase [Seongchinamella sediminis]RLQ22121.1 acetylornithine deacetylase [Seongchinamella sediminis]
MPTTEHRLIQQLSQLVGTPSVSSTDPSWDEGNRPVIDLLASWLADMGFRTEIQPVTEGGGKANLIATRGSGPGGLVLSGHTDTVPYDEGRWQSNPLGLTERDNRLYGLGSADMKGFFPVAMAAAASFSETALQQPLIILATADEESSMNGARALAAAGYPKARAAIIGEPTSLVPVRMHKGIMMEAVHINGHAGHSSNPDLGNSALDGMHAVMGDLMAYRGIMAERYSNPLFEVAYPTLNLGCLHGGDSPNRICGQSELHFDLRLTPAGDNNEVREDIRARLQQIGRDRGLDIEMRSLIQGVSPFEQDASSELVKLAEKLTGHDAIAVAFATEAPFLQQLGMETIVMGPGSIDRAHQPDEFMPLDQIQPAIRLLEQFIRHYCL